MKYRYVSPGANLCAASESFPRISHPTTGFSRNFPMQHYRVAYALRMHHHFAYTRRSHFARETRRMWKSGQWKLRHDNASGAAEQPESMCVCTIFSHGTIKKRVQSIVHTLYIRVLYLVEIKTRFMYWNVAQFRVFEFADVFDDWWGCVFFLCVSFRNVFDVLCIIEIFLYK